MLARYRSGAQMSQTFPDKICRFNNGPSPRVMESLFDAIGRGVILTNNDGVVTFMNGPAEALLQADKGSVVGKKVYMLPLRTPVYRVLSESCGDAAAEIALKGRVLAVRSSEVRNREGVSLGEMTEIWDVTSEKKEKRRLEEFVAMVTHDLKSPLTVMTGYLQMLKMRVYGDLDERVDAVIEQMEQSGSKMAAMIEDLLGTYQMEVGTMNFSRESSDLKTILEGCYQDNLNEAHDKELEFTLTTAANLPPAHLDIKQMSRVFNNLISNAIKFTPRGGNVAIGCAMEGKNLCISIRDTGIGIPRQDLTRIFKKYYRSTGAQGFKGTGLGLAISRAIVEAHGGDIEVESTEGKGSTFTVVIPPGETDI